VLRALERDHRCAIMCAEVLWWRCHRQIITDYLLAAAARVEHIMGAGQIIPATLAPGAFVTAKGHVALSSVGGWRSDR